MNCPFCTHAGILSRIDVNGRYFKECNRCGARSGERDTAKEAEQAWALRMGSSPTHERAAPAPDGYLEHTPMGDFLAYSATTKNRQTALYSLEKARAILASPTHERAAPAPEPRSYEPTAAEVVEYCARTGMSAVAAREALTEERLASPSQPAPAPEPAEEYSLSWIEHEAESLSRSQPVAAEGAPRSCRMKDGRCGICGGDWSVCGCEGMLRKGAGGADQG